METGYGLSRWAHGIDVMIPKKVDSIRVEKLRTIILFEADFNLINKIIGKRILRQAEQCNSVAPEQYGSRKKKTSIIHATNKLITFDIMRTRRQNTALLILDAMACYDRISPPLAALALRRQGTPGLLIKLMFDTLQNMSHTIRTSFGDSVQSYTKNDKKFHGILQGNGAGPTIWAMVSTPLLNRLRDKKFGVTFSSGVQEKITLPAFAFVDDTDLVQNIPDDPDFTRMPQLALKEWENGLITTGGALVPEKCSWFATMHVWRNDRWQLESKESRPGDIFLNQDDGTRGEVKRLEPKQSVLALGIMFSPSGTMIDEAAHLHQKAEHWGEQIRSNQVTRQEAWYMLNHIIMKTIEYPLTATTFTIAQVDKIMSPILLAGLTRSGICRNMAREVVYSSPKYLGLGVHYPYITQGIAKIMLFLGGGTDLTAKLIDSSWQLSALESGCGPAFLEKNIAPITKLLNRTMLSTTWEFVTKYGIALRNSAQDESRMVQDFYIMDKAAAFLSPTFLNGFNLCRIYLLQVELFSDIITPDGGCIKQSIWNGTTNSANNMNQDWYMQPKPSEKLWKLWRETLRLLVPMSQDGKLDIITPIANNINWKWYYSPSTNRLYEQTHTGIISRTQVLSRNIRRSDRHSKRFGTRYYDSDMIPLDGQMATVIQTEYEVTLEKSVYVPTVRQLKAPSWEDFMEETEVGEMPALKHAYLNNEVIMVCDGSMKDLTGASAWIITTEALRETTFKSGWSRTTADIGTDRIPIVQSALEFSDV
jgi:Reverse transcriptase (RNA-dependent DNA polymerase)